MINWYKTLVELIDLRSFSNLWYWIAVAAFWIAMGRRVIGVPLDVLARAHAETAHAEGAPAEGGAGPRGAALDAMAALHSARIRERAARSGPLELGLGAFFATLLAILGFGYGLELAQALVLILLPFLLIRGMEAGVAGRAEGLAGPALQRLMFWQRFRVQLLGILFILLTALWGMWQNMTASALGH